MGDFADGIAASIEIVHDRIRDVHMFEIFIFHSS